MARFGVFFLHDLKHINGILVLKDLPDEDPPEVKKLYGGSLKPKAVKKPNRPHQVTQAEERREFPWGADPSWTRIRQLLDTEPEGFLTKWELDGTWAEPQQFYCEILFVKFTRQLWLGLGESFVAYGRLPNPSTLQDAMEAWTVPNVQEVLGRDSCHFFPSCHGLTGHIPPNHHHKQKSFEERRAFFFPGIGVEIGNNSIWRPYAEDGYIYDYHNYLKEWDDEDINQLHKDMDAIFGQLQCLPLGVSSEIKGKQRIWAANSSRVNFITNSKYYKIKEVGKGGRRQQSGPKRPQASSAALKRRLQEENGDVVVGARTRRKSEKTLRKRKPPVRRQKQALLDGQSENEQEMPEPSRPRRMHTRSMAKRRALDMGDESSTPESSGSESDSESSNSSSPSGEQSDDSGS